MSKRAAESSPVGTATSPKSTKTADDEEIKPCVPAEEEMTPYDAFFKRLSATKDRDPKILGPTLIRGISRDDEDEDDEDEDSEEEEEVDKSKYTAEQMETLRYVMITKNREDKLNEMNELVLGDQAGGSFMCFNTSFSYDVMDAFYHLKNKLWARAKGPDAKFDLLFAFTQNVERYDCWMHDNEGGMEDWVKDLGSMWKRLLKNPDEKLDIDSEFTRPGIICFLDLFKKKVEEALNEYADPPLNFKFQ